MPFLMHPDRFPGLLMTCYRLCLQYFADVDVFREFLGATTARLHCKAAAAARLRAQAETAAALALLSPQPAAALVAATPMPASASVATSAAATPSTAAAAAGAISSVNSTASVRSSASSVSAGGSAVPAAAAEPAPLQLGKCPSVQEVVEFTRSAHVSLAAVPGAARAWYLPTERWLASCAVVTARCVDMLSAVTDVGGGGGGGSGSSDAEPESVIGRGTLIAAVGAMRETTFKGGAHIQEHRYKTMECADWKRTQGGYCPRGVRCDFAHGPVEVRVTSMRRPKPQPK